MPKFALRFERYLQLQSVVEIEAESLDDAVLAAGEVDTFNLEWEEPDLDCATVPRLYSVEQGDSTLARVGFAEDVGQAWPNVCLMGQWPHALDEPQTRGEINAFAHAATAHYGQLRPELSDEMRSEVEASRLRGATPLATSDALPVRRRI